MDTVFYSWQSDRPNSTNRGVIQQALESAIKALRKDDTLEVDPVLDRDTVGVPGAPDIADAIFDKIDASSVFVADVSLVTAPRARRSTPNPNVLIELGYALKRHGWENVILVQNTAFGQPEKLPFDLKMRRILTYCLEEGGKDRLDQRRVLESKLVAALRTILAAQVNRAGTSTESDSSKQELAQFKEDLLIEAKAISISEGLRDIAKELRSKLVPGSSSFWVEEYSDARFLERVSQYESACETLETYVAQGCYWSPRHHADLWPQMVETSAAIPIEGTHREVWASLRFYPALRVLYAGGMAALAGGKYSTVRDLLERPVVRELGSVEPAVFAICAPRVAEQAIAQKLPGMERRHTPMSDHLCSTMLQRIEPFIPSNAAFEELFDRFEYLLALVSYDLLSPDDTFPWVPIGSFGWRNRTNKAITKFCQEAEQTKEQWGPLSAGMFGGALDRFQKAKEFVDGRRSRAGYY